MDIAENTKMSKKKFKVFTLSTLMQRLS